MIKAEARMNGDGVDVNTEVDGLGGDVLEEAISIVKALHDGLNEQNRDMALSYVALVSVLAKGWLKELIHEEEKGDTYA